jgi:hypothetical protein
LISLKWTGPFETIERALILSTVLDEWELPPHLPRTQLRAWDNSYWLSAAVLGAIRFDLGSREVCAYPRQGCDPAWFEGMLVREWLPLVYQAWGYQVLHASAAVHRSSGRVVALSGEAGAGKSTLGYALGRRPGWEQLADESLVLQVEPGAVRIVPSPNRVRLRASSAAHFEQSPGDQGPITWPDGELSLGAVFFLEPRPDGTGENQAAEATRLDGNEAYLRLLNQAFALTLKMHAHNRRLMQDYLHIARDIPCYRLVYDRSFAALEEVLDGIEKRALE